MDIYGIVHEILQRATLIELREAIRTAEGFGDTVSVALFWGEIERRLGDE
jgi:hypothetical protein